MASGAPPSGYRWKILAMAYACQISFALVFQSIPPLLRLVVSEFELTHAQAGLLMSLFALPGIFISIPGGIISDRYGVKSVAVASMLFMIAGTFTLGVSGSFSMALLGRALSGIGAMILSIIMPQVLSSWFRPRELSLAMGIFNTGMPLGTFVSFNLLGSIGLSSGWRTSVLLTTVASGISLALFLFIFREVGHGVEADGRPQGTSRIGASIWLVGLAWMFFNAAFVAFLTFAQDFFVTVGYDVSYASFLTSLIALISLPMSPLVGYAIGRFGRENAFIAVGGLAMAALLFLMPNGADPLLLLVLIGMSGSLVPPPIFSLPSKLVDPRRFGISFGIISTCLNVGVLAGPYLVGLTKDLTGGYVWGFYIMSLFAVLQAFSILLLFSVRTRKTK